MDAWVQRNWTHGAEVMLSIRIVAKICQTTAVSDCCQLQSLLLVKSQYPQYSIQSSLPNYSYSIFQHLSYRQFNALSLFCHGIILKFTYLRRHSPKFKWSINFADICRHLNGRSTNGNWWPNWQFIPAAELMPHSPRHTANYQVSKTKKISSNSCSLISLLAYLD